MIIEAAELFWIRYDSPRKSIVFCSGTFDIPHVAHALFFQDCKKFGDILVICVGGDDVLKDRKPGRPVMTESARLRMIDFLKPVDYCYLNTVSIPEEPLKALKHAFENLRPNHYVVKDEAFDLDQRREMCDRFVVKMHVLKRDFETKDEFRAVSTSGIIERILGKANGDIRKLCEHDYFIAYKENFEFESGSHKAAVIVCRKCGDRKWV